MLGAIVAPPDAVVASSVLCQFKLPRRIVVVFECESLINDDSSPFLYRFTVPAAAAGTVRCSCGALQFVGMALGGALVGWLVGQFVMWVFARIDTLRDITVSLVAALRRTWRLQRCTSPGCSPRSPAACCSGDSSTRSSPPRRAWKREPCGVSSSSCSPPCCSC